MKTIEQVQTEFLEQALFFCGVKEARTEAIRRRNSYRCTEADETYAPCRLHEVLNESEWCEQCRLHQRAHEDERDWKNTENKALRKLRRLALKLAIQQRETFSDELLPST